MHNGTVISLMVEWMVGVEVAHLGDRLHSCFSCEVGPRYDCLIDYVIRTWYTCRAGYSSENRLFRSCDI